MRRFCLLSTIVLLVACALPAAAQDTNQRAQQARAQLETLRSKIEQVRASIQQGQAHHEQLEQKLAAAGHAVRQAQERLETLKHNIADLEQQVAKLKQQRDTERAHLVDEINTLRAQVRAAYRTGRTNKLRLLLSGEDPARIGRMLVYYEYFARQQSQQAARLRGMLAKLARRQSALEAQQQQLAAQRAERRAALQQLKQSRADRQAAMAALESRLRAQHSTLADYQQSAEQLQKLIDTLQHKLTPPDNTPSGTFTALKGRMRPPVYGPVIAHFGDSKANGQLQWQGQWRAAPKGTPIRAVADGRVVYVGYMHHYGLIVVLEHGDEYFTVYGHTQSSYVSVGEQVSQGQAIALTGTSGGHRRSGVYFEIRHGRQALDPSVWLGG